MIIDIVARESVKSSQNVLLSDLLGALSYALDLTEGQPAGHCIRATYIAQAIGRRLGLPDLQLWELYYMVMLKDLGCSSNAARICELYLSDDISFKQNFKTLGTSLPKILGFVVSHTGRKSPLGERLKAIVNILKNGGEIVDELIETRCHRGAEIAAALRFPRAVCEGIHALDERWNGEGRPERRAGTAIPLYARIALLSQVVDVFHSAAGPQAALDEIEARTGHWFDPHIANVFAEIATEPSFWDELRRDDLAQRVVGMEPPGSLIRVDDKYLDEIAQAFAQVIDSKSPFTSGHSERVAIYAEITAQQLGYSEADCRWLKRAALLHDIGKLGVSNSILDKNGKLDDEEWIAMRSHADLSEKILARVPIFSEMARIGGAHHEKLDGRGYPRGLKGDEIDERTRIVSVADVFDALTADRPYRAAMSVEKALSIMWAEVGSAFDGRCLAALERAITQTEIGFPRVA
ncbi:HD domain-containing phosphohydrolase [Fulvimarina sp. 2208YS6-2-32]|uniref:HD domain-containing phosphohydrolase n=1 Tax=Fulvimarina uroteuthidis TaxID=3098149 RepID=A0ABU5I7I0_9HYPH|nr:HD domain-containing phosphohydrolase [Fulvimarina sp. 2208YS6-2-32]MDY8111072.1 HD domain-containing phosphohydrolase [Fulvimarina sp. 2208YS6-2-32]